MTGTVIVGAGQAGYAAAVTMKKLLPDMPVQLIGREASAPYERPPLSKELLAPNETAMAPLFLPEQAYADRGIELRTGLEITEIDRAARLLRHRTSEIAYDKLVLATGGSARTLPVPGGDLALYLRGQDDLVALRRAIVPGARIAIIGAGVIGLELAATARKTGAAVTLFETASTPMARMLPASESAWLRARHEQEGVSFRFGESLTAIRRDDLGFHVETKSGVHACDAVIGAVGLVRETALAQAAGLAVDNGILTDAFGRTDDPNIFAAGDVAAFWHPVLGARMRLESYAHALDHGAAVAKAIAGVAEPYAPLPKFWTHQYDLQIHVAGDLTLAVSAVRSGQPGQPGYFMQSKDADGRTVFVLSVGVHREFRKLAKEMARNWAAERTAV